MAGIAAKIDLSTYLVTDSSQAGRSGHSLLDIVDEAVAGGVTAVQVREKTADDRAVLDLVEALAARLPSHVALFVNDRIDVFVRARAHGARVSGVHVGQTDLPVLQVREQVGPDALIGLTANTLDQLRAAEATPARIDYVGIGAVHATGSKADAPQPIGVAGVAALTRQCTLPAVAIGGITPEDLPALRAGGLAGAAVVSWICAATDPRQAAVQLVDAWNAGS